MQEGGKQATQPCKGGDLEPGRHLEPLAGEPLKRRAGDVGLKVLIPILAYRSLG